MHSERAELEVVKFAGMRANLAEQTFAKTDYLAHVA
jgi:hypothetical protein